MIKSSLFATYLSLQNHGSMWHNEGRHMTTHLNNLQLVKFLDILVGVYQGE